MALSQSAVSDLLDAFRAGAGVDLEKGVVSVGLAVQQRLQLLLGGLFGQHLERGLGLDDHPQLRAVYFGNYERVVLLAQTAEHEVRAAAGAAAERLDLPLEIHEVGRDGLASGLPVSLRVGAR